MKKQCLICEELRTDYYRDQTYKKGIYICRKCRRKPWMQHLQRAYNGQTQRSKLRDHEMGYIFPELAVWAKEHGYEEMYDEYVKNEQEIRLAPSINRLLPKYGYDFKNIELLTWGDHKDEEPRKGKPIWRCDESGKVLERYPNVQCAVNEKFKADGIYACLNKRQWTHKGYAWCWALQ